MFEKEKNTQNTQKTKKQDKYHQSLNYGESQGSYFVRSDLADWINSVLNQQRTHANQSVQLILILDSVKYALYTFYKV